jgi:hypothetical protein
LESFDSIGLEIDCMNQIRSTLLCTLAAGLVAGCASSKTTTLKLSGDRGTPFDGYYSVAGVSNIVSGTLPARFTIDGALPDEWEFRKQDRSAALRITTYHGGRRGLRINAKPGTLGARLASDDGRHYEILE